jgi:hypothetical protein
VDDAEAKEVSSSGFYELVAYASSPATGAWFPPDEIFGDKLTHCLVRESTPTWTTPTVCWRRGNVQGNARVVFDSMSKRARTHPKKREGKRAAFKGEGSQLFWLL